MSGIPYNELQPIEITAKDDSGEIAVLETLYFSIVIPCKDCKYANHYHPLDYRTGKPHETLEEWYCDWHSNPEGASEIDPDGFCAWGERREPEWVMCKCGESIELGDRESAVCPSCGRTVRE